MSKRTETEIKKVSGVDAAYLSKYVEDDHSLDGMDEFRVVPQVKVIQGNSDRALKEAFGEGTVIIRPGDALIAKEGEDFTFVPLLFFVEWCKWRDFNDQESSMILARSHDPTSELAKKARDPELRFEPYSEKFKYRYVEHLRFPGIFYGEHILAGTPVTLSFERGEHWQGRNFISAVKLRKAEVDDTKVNVPLWAQAWQLKSMYRERGAYAWYGFDFSPADPPVIREEDVEAMRNSHLELKELHERNKLVVEEDLQEDDEGAVVENSDF